MRPFSALCARISLVLCAPDPCVMCVDRLCRRDAAIPPRKPHCSASAAFSAANSVVSTDAAYVRPTQWILTFEGLILAYSSRSAQPYAASKTILKQSHVRAHDRCLPDTNISRKFTLLSFGYHKFFFDHSLTGTWCCTPRMISALLPAPTQFLNHPKRFTWWQSESNPVRQSILLRLASGQTIPTTSRQFRFVLRQTLAAPLRASNLRRSQLQNGPKIMEICSRGDRQRPVQLQSFLLRLSAGQTVSSRESSTLHPISTILSQVLAAALRARFSRRFKLHISF